MAVAGILGRGVGGRLGNPWGVDPPEGSWEGLVPQNRQEVGACPGLGPFLKGKEEKSGHPAVSAVFRSEKSLSTSCKRVGSSEKVNKRVSEQASEETELPFTHICAPLMHDSPK